MNPLLKNSMLFRSSSTNLRRPAILLCVLATLGIVSQPVNALEFTVISDTPSEFSLVWSGPLTEEAPTPFISSYGLGTGEFLRSESVVYIRVGVLNPFVGFNNFHGFDTGESLFDGYLFNDNPGSFPPISDLDGSDGGADATWTDGGRLFSFSDTLWDASTSAWSGRLTITNAVPDGRECILVARRARSSRSGR